MVVGCTTDQLTRNVRSSDSACSRGRLMPPPQVHLQPGDRHGRIAVLRP